MAKIKPKPKPSLAPEQHRVIRIIDPIKTVDALENMLMWRLARQQHGKYPFYTPTKIA